MSANATESSAAQTAQLASTAEQQSSVPKKITNAQTVCNEKNEKGKLCNGHLKQLQTGGEEARQHLRGDDVLFQCQSCGVYYMGPPMGHVRDPDKQQRFIERELASLLQAAGGTLPVIKKNEKGVYVMVEAGAEHAHAPAAAKPAAAPAKTAAATPAAKPAPKPAAPPADETPEQKRARQKTEAAVRKSTQPPIPGASGPVPGETFEQKIARLRAVVAEAKRRAEAAEAGGEAEAAHTTPTAATTSGTDSSAQADLHRPAAEAQAATGMASAVPLSPAAATASPAAGAETVADLAPDASTEKTTSAPRAAAGGLKRMDYDTGPMPGETHEQKIERLKAFVAEAKRRAGKE